MRRALFVAALSAVVVSAHGETRAADGGAPGSPGASGTTSAADALRRSQPVVEIGPRQILVGEVEDRLAALPAFQRASFGADADAIRHKFVLEVLVPEGLFALGAADQKLDQKLPTAFDVERALQDATLRAVRRSVGPESDVPMTDVQAYYDANRDRYDTPERYEIWRILCKTKEEADGLLDTLRTQLTPQHFNELARQHSQDKASNLRSGNLGFLTADGTSNEPGLKVDPAIVKAARTVHDGQLVPTSVPEGTGFSVVWRKGTIAANKRTVTDVTAQIRDTIWKARVKKESDDLVAELRAKKLKDLNEGPLSELPAAAPEQPGRPRASAGD